MSEILSLVQANLLSPVVLCFVLGAIACLVRSDLKLPEPVFNALSVYLLLSIGLRGGAELARGHFAEIIGPALGALLIGCAIPLWVFPALRRFAGLSAADAAAMGAHYGSVSAVTFAAVQSMLDRQGIPYEPYVTAMLALMEAPAIIVALALARVGRQGGSGEAGGFRAALAEVMSGKSVLLLAGGLTIGLIADPSGIAKVKPLFLDAFQGMLCLFLLELGRVAASRAGDFRKVGVALASFALVAPILHAGLGVLVAKLTGLSLGGGVVLATLAASSSYIAAPAAVRLALPEANPGYYLTASLAITFPFNIAFGLPLYEAMARAVLG